jgi:aryl-alcohol dehydrogenase-like predicted oxidoreductase
MTFGEQVDESVSHQILDRSLALGINFIDTAEMYSVPARAETCGATETIIGNWLSTRPGARQKLVLATKVAGPSRGMPWVREGSGMTAQDILNSCDASLKRLKTDVIDLYQIHWPERHVPSFGAMYFDPAKDKIETSIHDQLLAMEKLVKAGKVRYIGLSNETPYGTHEFVRLAEQHGLPRVMTHTKLPTDTLGKMKPKSRVMSLVPSTVKFVDVALPVDESTARSLPAKAPVAI